MDLEFLDQQQLAVILRHEDRDIVLFGTGVYRKACGAPRELVLLPDQKCESTRFLESLVIREDEWQGRVYEDTQHGRDYRIEIDL